MPTSATVTARVLRVVLETAKEAGVDRESILRAAGLPLECADDADARIPVEALRIVWRETARRTGDEAIGLHAALRVPPGAFGVLEYVTRASPTLGGAYRRLVRYVRLLNDGAEAAVSEEGEWARLGHRVPADPRGQLRHSAEFALASWLIFGRRVTRLDWNPREVRFQHPAPSDLSEHARIFRAPVHFEEPTNEIIFDRALLDRPLAGADPGLCSVLDRHAEDLLARLPPASDFSSRVRRLVCSGLRGGDPGVEAVARTLAMSARTLHRRLREEGTSYRDLLDEIRRDLALRHLEERSAAISDIAFVLGFSDSTAFHRAFKRWMGMTPAEYRAGRSA